MAVGGYDTLEGEKGGEGRRGRGAVSSRVL